MPEIQRSVETNDNLSENPRFDLIRILLKSRFTRILAFVLMAMGVTGCARESRILIKENCENFSARTHKNADGSRVVDKIIVHPTNSPKAYQCVIEPKCRKVSKDERLEIKDCVDWSEPCVEK
jgi:hypothetical protein